MGRPSLEAERRAQILDAFEACLAEDGLEATTLARVAGRAGVQRAAIRHFVGNRADLVAEAVAHLCAKYGRAVSEALRTRPKDANAVDAMLDYLFLGGFVTDLDREGRAVFALRAAAAHDPDARAALRAMYDALEDRIAWVMAGERGDPDDPAVRGAAYAVACLAEESAFQLEIDAPHDRAFGARAAAARILAGVTEAATSARSPARP